jgi:hypothetical protein
MRITRRRKRADLHGRHYTARRRLPPGRVNLRASWHGQQQKTRESPEACPARAAATALLPGGLARWS